jgi:methionine synthase reductase
MLYDGCVPIFTLHTHAYAALLCSAVCSTTGNGDSPENSDAFWRSIKKRSLPKDYLAGVPFSVLGLGDTNYDKFCYMGKMIDKRMGELGARRVVELSCADEPTNLEEVVEAWKLKVAAAIQELAGAAGDESDKSGNSSEVSAGCVEAALDKLSVGGEASCAAVLPGGVRSAGAVWALLGLQGDRTAPPLAKLLPGGAATSAPDPIEVLASGAAPGGAQLTDRANSKTDLVSAARTEWTAERPFPAPVVSARYLTEGAVFEDGAVGDRQCGWGEDKKVIEMFLSLQGSGMAYEPGDSVAVCCPNPQPLVDMVLARLNAAPPGPGLAPVAPLGRDTVVRRKNCEDCSVEELLSYK